MQKRSSRDRIFSREAASSSDEDEIAITPYAGGAAERIEQVVTSSDMLHEEGQSGQQSDPLHLLIPNTGIISYNF